MQTFELEKHLIILGKHISLQATDPTNPRAVFPLGLGGEEKGLEVWGGRGWGGDLPVSETFLSFKTRFGENGYPVQYGAVHSCPHSVLRYFLNIRNSSMINISEYFIVLGISGFRVWGSLRDAHVGPWVSCRAGHRWEAHPWARPHLSSPPPPQAWCC